MFDRSVVTGSGSGPTTAAPRPGRSPREARAGRVALIRRAELRIEAMVLRDAANWAIEHGVDADDPFATGPAGGVGKFVGSDGTPWIDEHVAKEYGALRGTSTMEASELIIDALDLRHRFPRLWSAIRQLAVRVRVARRISRSCRELSREAAAAVDAELARKAAWGLPWARLEKILAAAVINANPALAAAKIAAAKFDQRVWLSGSEDGLRTMIIRADAGDQVLLYALIDRIADILGLDGDTDPVDVRRAKAAGWLASPEDLVVLLYRHAAPGTGSPTAPESPGYPAAPDDAAASSSVQDPAADDEEYRAAAEGEPVPDESAQTQEGSGEEWSTPTTPESASPESPGRDSASSDDDSDGSERVPQPPPDWPEFDWNQPEPKFDPGPSENLPAPPSHWAGTEHRPGPEPHPPAWCYEPPDDPDPPDPKGMRLGCDVPRLVDWLTAKGLKPARPRVVLHVHLTDQTLLTGDGVVRSEECGPMLLSQLTELLGRHHCAISVRPVLDPANLAAVDAYEIPQALRDAVRTRHPASVFPFSSRTGKHLDLDHTIPHTRSADPAGQTSVGNLGPLARSEHRAKTAGVWQVDQPHPGVFLWKSPHGYYFLVTNHGTQALGPRP